MVLEPIYETDFDQYSFGFRPGRCTHDAIKAAYLAMNNRKKMFWVIDADIEGFFDNVDHQTLEQILQDRISDQSVRDLIWDFLKAGIMEDGRCRYPTSGTPQGGIVSPLLANIYLNELDRWASQFTHLPKLERDRRRRRGKGNWRYIRYADDFLLLTNGSRKNAEAMEERVSGYLSNQLNLTLSPRKTTVVHANDGFDFLGCHLQRKEDGRGGKVAKWTIPESAKKELKDKVRAATAGNPDVSVRAKIRALNRIIRGWSSYYRYATDASGTFSSLDYFVWKRLMDWLATKYRSSLSEVWDNHLESSSPITINGRSILQMQGHSTVYGESHTKEGHPYLTDAKWERESLPRGTYWLSNVEERNGWRDQRWKALERDDWRCQNCERTSKMERPASTTNDFEVDTATEKKRTGWKISSACALVATTRLRRTDKLPSRCSAESRNAVKDRKFGSERGLGRRLC